MALPRGCVRVGCALSVVFVLAGTLLSIVGVAAAREDPELLGFDLRRFDVLGLFDATAHTLALDGYAPAGAGADLTVRVVPAEGAWQWTALDVRAAQLVAGDERVELSVTGLVIAVTRGPSDAPAPTELRLHADSLPAAPGPWTIELTWRFSASSWGGLNSIQTNRTSQLVIPPEQRR